MRLRLHGRTVAGFALALLFAVAVAFPGPGWAQDPNQKTKGKADVTSKKTDLNGRASGVITKIERITAATPANPDSTTDKSDRLPGHRTFRLTINTAAVWRDWARDQATQSPSEPARKEAAEGANSIATKGEPQDKNTVVVVDLTTETKVETRFRAPDDETSKGTKTPEAARSDTERRDSAKPTRFDAKDLKTGLFVEADFHHVTGQNRASTLAVIRPVADTSTTKEKSK